MRALTCDNCAALTTSPSLPYRTTPGGLTLALCTSFGLAASDASCIDSILLVIKIRWRGVQDQACMAPGANVLIDCHH